jgi:hypothetical protein
MFTETFQGDDNESSRLFHVIGDVIMGGLIGAFEMEGPLFGG